MVVLETADPLKPASNEDGGDDPLMEFGLRMARTLKAIRRPPDPDSESPAPQDAANWISTPPD